MSLIWGTKNVFKESKETIKECTTGLDESGVN